MTGLKALAVAVLELLARSAWTWIVTSDLLVDMNRHIALLLSPVCHKVGAGSLHLLHFISLRLLRSRSLCLRRISERDESSEEE